MTPCARERGSPALHDQVEDTEAPEKLNGHAPILLRENLLERPPEPIAGNPLEGAALRSAANGRGETRVESEAEPRRVAHGPESPCRIVRQRALVKEPDPLLLEIPLAAERVEKYPVDARAGEPAGHRVNREVPPGEVPVDGRARLHDGKSSRMWVALLPGGGDVDPPSVRPGQSRRSEAIVTGLDAPPRLCGERRDEPRRRARRPLESDVHVDGRPSKQEVADGPADEIRLPPRRPSGTHERAEEGRYESGIPLAHEWS